MAGLSWFIPSWNGDFRLEKKGKKGCMLSVVKPTAHELKVLAQFLGIAHERGWTNEEEITEENNEIVLKADVAEAGRELVNLYMPVDSSITAVKFADGRLEVADASGTWELIQKAEREEVVAEKKRRLTDGEFDEKMKKEEGEQEGAKAATVKRPTLSCPECFVGAIEPATEVLLSFLTPQQHRDWSERRAILVEGGTTGHRYLLAHRHSEMAQKFGRICYDCEDEAVLHFYDMTVPPEEEVLAAKLILEHREPWLRNHSSCLPSLRGHGVERFTEVFDNPLGPKYVDGVETAKLMTGLGAAVAASALADMAGIPQLGLLGEALGFEEE